MADSDLQMLGSKVPQDMDGRVLKEIFTEESPLTQRAVEYQPEQAVVTEPKEEIYTKDEEEKVKKRLSDLGYLE
jgi:hypothetical protein